MNTPAEESEIRTKAIAIGNPVFGRTAVVEVPSTSGVALTTIFILQASVDPIFGL